MPIIGENETIFDMKKSKRPDNLIFKLDKKCPSNYKNNYEWSDLKSSLLVQEIVNDDVEYGGLCIFMREILERIFIYMSIDIYDEIDEYMPAENDVSCFATPELVNTMRSMSQPSNI
jgi:hypothetical protein